VNRRILQVGPLKPSLAATLTERYDALVLPDDHARATFLAEHGPSIGAVVTTGRTGVAADLMAQLPSLGAIVNFGVGYDTTDVEAAAARGVLISNTPDVLTDCVADTAIGLAIDTLRRLSDADRFVRRGDWPEAGTYPLTRKVSGKRVGIVGLGRIGQAIATRFEAFGCPISYHSRREVPGSPYAYAASPAELAADVDILVVATSGGSGTQHLVDRQVLEALGPEGYLVNIARGAHRADGPRQRGAPPPPGQRHRRDPRRHGTAGPRQPRPLARRRDRPHSGAGGDGGDGGDTSGCIVISVIRLPLRAATSKEPPGTASTSPTCGMCPSREIR
jgi:lactate dehydrogenase-like 2-hydroxyacid dehydrogenase